MIVIECPNEVYSVESSLNEKLFLAGGITNCPDWQAEVIKELQIHEKTDGFFKGEPIVRDTVCNPLDVTVYNPRRKNFPINNPNAAEEQIVWEYNHLRDIDLLVFWFSRGTLNPIVLYELGRWGNSSDKPMCVCIDPEYQRIQDVIVQTKLSRLNVPIFTPKTEAEGVASVKNWIVKLSK